MNSQNTVVVDAVSAHNKALVEQAQNEALNLIAAITNEQAKIASCEDRIKINRTELDKLAKDIVDEASVFGGSLPENANKETISKVIVEANKAKQFNVEQSSKRLVQNINAEQDAIKAVEKRIADLREKLTKLSAPVVTVDQIVG